ETEWLACGDTPVLMKYAALWATIRQTSLLARAGVRDNIYGPSERQPDLVRCIMGNPFRPVKLDRGCLTPAIRALAEAACEEPKTPPYVLDAGRLAVLADAMEEAGGPAELVEHLRAPGPHARGCWAVD